MDGPLRRFAINHGRLLFSSYSEKFWPHRLEWFRRQAEAGLLGEIDESRTGDGTIVCKDGFTATTFGPERFLALARLFPVEARIVEIDESSLFCEMTRRQPSVPRRPREKKRRSERRLW
ncbi:MAG: hypothetical protein FJY82_05975 [Candidatus Aminicenantes bacterium]|nr:hypothetical protein [Candidatus Aminicenantes bacterium]